MTKPLNLIALTLLSSMAFGCDMADYEADHIDHQDVYEMPTKAVTVRLLGPGERGNYFQVRAQNFSLTGKCFDANINGVKGQGRLISGPNHTYNLFIYFHSRHSPKGDWEALKAIQGGVEVPVEFKVSKCSRNGFYEPSKKIASFYSDVKVIPEP